MPEPIKTLDVSSRRWWVDTGIDVTPGDVLRFEAAGTWWDASHEAGPDGVDIPKLKNWRWLRRVRGADWAELVGVIGRFGGFPIGAARVVQCDRAGRLRLFFNDAFGFYRNNRGVVQVRIYRE